MAVKGLYYQLSFKNADRDLNYNLSPQTVFVRIYDLSLEGSDTVDHEVITIDGAGTPFVTSSVDNSEDKFTGIRPTQATIKFLSSGHVNLSNFITTDLPTGGIDPGDPRWYVEAFLNSYDSHNFIFKGFLNLDDCSFRFMPDNKEEITLVANDGLAGLKNIALVDFNGNNPKDENRIADYLAWALKKTGLSINLNAIFNIRQVSTQHFFDTVYLHAKTFEEKIGVSINCYDVIERILGDEAFLCQRGGEWWIIRIDELANENKYYKTIFNADGTLTANTDDGKFYIKEIGKDGYAMWLSQESTTVHPIRPDKYIKESFKFEYPQEIIDNIDFSRGDLDTSLPMPNMTVDGQTLYQSKCKIEDWQAWEVPTGVIGGTASPSSTNNYIRKLYSDSTKTVEQERYVVIEKHSPAKGFYIQSNKFPVNKNDKFDISVSVRWSNDGAFPSSGDYRIGVMQVRLHGNSGTNYMLCGGYQIGTDNYQIPYWKPTGTSFAGVENFYVQGNLTEDMSTWKTASFITKNGSNPHPCPPIPEAGKIEIILDHSSYSDQTDIHFNNLSFKYIPYINGGYPDYSEFYYKISQDRKLINNRESRTYLSSGFAPLMKGVLKKSTGWQTFLVSQAAIIVTSLGPDVRIAISVSTGDVRNDFYKGQKIKISGTTSNNGVYTVETIDYYGGNTVIGTIETLTAEAFPTITLQSETFDLATQFYAYNDIHTISPDSQYIHPYGHIQAYDIWNQCRNLTDKFNATVQGLENSNVDDYGYLDYPSLIHRFLLKDSHDTTDNRYFMLLTFNIDWFLCEWAGTLVEVYNSTIGKSYLDILETKYEQ